MAEPYRSARGGDSAAGDDPRLRMVERAMKKVQYRPDALIEVLHVAQESYGFLGDEILHTIARAMNVPESRVFGVATFYNFFSLRPKGEHSCIVCTGTACYVKGAGEIVTALEQEYGIRPGETTPDGRLHVGAARCLGSCSLAPMLTLDGKVLGCETADSVLRQVRELLEGEEGGR